MQKLHQDTYEALRRATKDIVAPVADKLRDVERQIESGDYAPEFVRDVLKPERDELRKQLRAAKDEAAESANIKARLFIKEQQEALKLDASKLTDDARLLNCGVVLEERDLCAILDRSKDNLTMTQLAHKYAQQHDISLPKEYVYTGDVEAVDKIRQAEGLGDVVQRYVTRYIDQPDGLDTLDRFFSVEQ